MLEAVGLVDANPVDHLATVLGGHMKEVEDDLGPGALVADLGFEGGAHVHDHRLEPLAPPLAQELEERAVILASAAPADPQDLLDDGIDHHRGVAVPLVDGELVHGDHADAGKLNGAERFMQIALVDRLDRIPAEPEERRHLFDRRNRAQPRHALRQALGGPGIAPQPRQPLQLRAAPRTQNPPSGNLQPGRGIENRQIADAATADLVKRARLASAAVADRRPPGYRLQRNPDLRARPFDPLNTTNPIAFPAAKPGNIIVHRQRSLLPRIQIFDNPNTSRDAVAYTTLPGFPG